MASFLHYLLIDNVAFLSDIKPTQPLWTKQCYVADHAGFLFQWSPYSASKPIIISYYTYSLSWFYV